MIFGRRSGRRKGNYYFWRRLRLLFFGRRSGHGKGNYYFGWRLRFLFLEDEAVIEKKIDNHNDDGVEAKCTGSENKFIGKWKMEGATDIVGKIVEWGEHAEKLGETRSDEKSE